MLQNTRLMRPTNGRMMAGVCAGLANYFGIDPTIVRLVFLVSVLFLGISPLAYVVLWIVMPEAATVPAALPNSGPTGEWQYDPHTGERIQK